ncbi:hypothetical protein [Nostoc sp. UIC 10630]|nr:hypothetical protein [Nostoc sp. UIC 10630]
MKRNPTLPPNFMLGYAIAAPNLQNYYCDRFINLQIIEWHCHLYQ